MRAKLIISIVIAFILLFTSYGYKAFGQDTTKVEIFELDTLSIKFPVELNNVSALQIVVSYDTSYFDFLSAVSYQGIFDLCFTYVDNLPLIEYNFASKNQLKYSGDIATLKLINKKAGITTIKINNVNAYIDSKKTSVKELYYDYGLEAKSIIYNDTSAYIYIREIK